MSHWLLYKKTDSWLITKLDTSEEKEIAIEEMATDEQAKKLAEAFYELQYDGGPVLMTIDSVDCFAVTLTVDDPSLFRDRQAVLYEIEQYMPLPAEEFTADFVRHGDTVFATAIRTDGLSGLLAMLEEQGIYIASLVPSALLHLQGFFLGLESDIPKQNEEEIQTYIWNNASHTECVFVKEETPFAWQLIHSKEENQITQAHAAQAKCLHQAVTIKSFDRCLPEAQELGPFPEKAHFLAADTILAGQTSGWIELRRDRLAVSDRYRPIRYPLRFAMLGAAALIVALSAMMFFRSWQYAELADACQKRQAEVFHEVLPNQDIQTGFRDRLQSEKKRLAGLRGNVGELPERISVLEPLHRLLSAMPARLRFRFTELRLESEQIHLHGQVRTHSDADRIATSLRKKGFTVDSPSTQKLPDRGIGVRISAKWRGEKKQGEKK